MNLMQLSIRISGLVDTLDELTERVKQRGEAGQAADSGAVIALLLMEARTEAAKLARASHVLALEGMKAERS